MVAPLSTEESVNEYPDDLRSISRPLTGFPVASTIPARPYTQPLTNDFLDHSSKRTLSRRTLLRGSFAGLGMAAFLRSANASPQDSSSRPAVDEATTAEVTFKYPLASGTGGFNDTFGCFTNGWCVIAAGTHLFSAVQ